MSIPEGVYTAKLVHFPNQVSGRFIAIIDDPGTPQDGRGIVLALFNPKVRGIEIDMSKFNEEVDDEN